MARISGPPPRLRPATGEQRAAAANRPTRAVGAPLLVRELRSRARGRRTGWVVAAWIMILGITAAIAVLGAAGGGLTAGATVADRAPIGRSTFQWVAFVAAVVVVLAAPASAATTVAGERERGTLAGLRGSLLGARGIVLQKAGAAAATVAAVVATALPLLVLVSGLGGVALSRALGTGTVLVAVAAVVTSAVVGVSAMAHRPASAIGLALAVVAALAVGSFALWGIAAVFDGAAGDDPVDPPGILLAPNPVVIVADAGADRSGGVAVGTPLDGLASLARTGGGPPVWAIGLGVDGILAAALLVLGTWRVRSLDESG